MTPLEQMIIMGIFKAVLLGSLIMFVLTFRDMVRETRLPGRRLFGFNCDVCHGKYRRNGKPLFRCYVKKPILGFMLKRGIVKPCSGGPER